MSADAKPTGTQVVTTIETWHEVTFINIVGDEDYDCLISGGDYRALTMGDHRFFMGRRIEICWAKDDIEGNRLFGFTYVSSDGDEKGDDE